MNPLKSKQLAVVIRCFWYTVRHQIEYRPPVRTSGLRGQPRWQTLQSVAVDEPAQIQTVGRCDPLLLVHRPTSDRISSSGPNVWAARATSVADFAVCSS